MLTCCWCCEKRASSVGGWYTLLIPKTTKKEKVFFVMESTCFLTLYPFLLKPTTPTCFSHFQSWHLELGRDEGYQKGMRNGEVVSNPTLPMVITPPSQICKMCFQVNGYPFNYLILILFPSKVTLSMNLGWPCRKFVTNRWDMDKKKFSPLARPSWLIVILDSSEGQCQLIKVGFSLHCCGMD